MKAGESVWAVCDLVHTSLFHSLRRRKLGGPTVTDEYLEVKTTLKESVMETLETGHPDLCFSTPIWRDQGKGVWGFHSRESAETREMINIDCGLLERAAEVLAEDASEDAPEEMHKYTILLLYIITKIHEMQHYVVSKTLPFVGKTPKEVGRMYTSDINIGESGFGLEEELFGCVFVTVWKRGDAGNVDRIARLTGLKRVDDGFFHKLTFYELGKDPMFAMIKSFVDNVIKGEFEKIQLPVFQHPFPENLTTMLASDEVRGRSLSITYAPSYLDGNEYQQAAEEKGGLVGLGITWLNETGGLAEDECLGGPYRCIPDSGDDARLS
uniref:Uncharacterized protein n=1 Tax=Moniliophthora roreri TaxID=221103 RepID=A0A0W0F019_MONRR